MSELAGGTGVLEGIRSGVCTLKSARVKFGEGQVKVGRPASTPDMCQMGSWVQGANGSLD